MLATDLRAALDPVVLAEQAGICPDGWQREVLQSDARQLILLCSRQAGKSTVAALLALHEALYRPGALVILLSPSQRQSGELLHKVNDLNRALGRPVPAQAESLLRLELENGSRIISLPGSKEGTIRGYSGAALVVVDEASRVDDALYQAVRPMVAVSGGRIVLLSTPFGKRGFLFHEWTDGGPAWHRVKITAEQCPRIPKTWLEQERGAIGDWWYRQEYLCEFVDTVDQVFGFDEVMAALDPNVHPLFDGLSA